MTSFEPCSSKVSGGRMNDNYSYLIYFPMHTSYLKLTDSEFPLEQVLL